MEEQLPSLAMNLNAHTSHRGQRGMDRMPPPPPGPQSHATTAHMPFPRAPLQQAPAQQSSTSAVPLSNSAIGLPIHQRQVQTQAPPSQERPPRHGVEIIDLRHETMTDADARLLLSTYIVIRMEKSYNLNETDEVGNPIIPNWKRITTTEQTDISQQEATRKVRELDKRGPSVTNKKDDMPSPLQRQIEKAQERLHMRERDYRYDYVLAQLDCKMKEIDETSPLYRIYGGKKDKNKDKGKNRDRAESQSKYKDNDRTNKKKSNKKSKESRKFERVSVTAYFRRIPRPEVDAMTMFQEKQGSRGHQPAPRHMPMSHEQMQPPAQFTSQTPANMPQQQQNMPAHHLSHQTSAVRTMASTHQPPHPLPPTQPVYTESARPLAQPVRQAHPGPPHSFPNPGNNGNTGSNRANGRHGPHETSHSPKEPPVERQSTPRVNQVRHPSPASSYMSDEDWDSEESEYLTPGSSIGSESRPEIHTASSKSRHRRSDRAEESRLVVPRQHQSKRDHNKRDHNKRHRDPVASSRTPPTLLSSRPDTLLPHVDIDSIKRKAYREALDDAVASLQPLVVQFQRPSLPRGLSAYEARRAMQRDRLDEIGEALDRDADVGNRRPQGNIRERDRRYDLLADYFDRGRQQDGRPRRRNELLEDIFNDDDCEPEARWAVPRAQSYMRTREDRAERQTSNPLAPAGLYYHR